MSNMLACELMHSLLSIGMSVGTKLMRSVKKISVSDTFWLVGGPIRLRFDISGRKAEDVISSSTDGRVSYPGDVTNREYMS